MIDIDNIKDKGGRPPKSFIRDRIIQIMKALKAARPYQVAQEYAKSFNDEKPADFKTIQKYMDVLADKDRILTKTPVFDNAAKVRKKESSMHRQIFFYEFNLEHG
ncbi:MAG: hypothetical protein AABX74_05805 [Nanoarchaeota archaeon]